MAYHCAVKNCSNGSYRLNKWKKQLCDECGCLHREKGCTCEAPFRLYPFPTRLKNPNERQKWKQVINRCSAGSNKLWSPSKDSRVCSNHFHDGRPTMKNRLPTCDLGYDGFESKIRRTLFFNEDSNKNCFTFKVKDVEKFIAVPFYPDPPVEDLQMPDPYTPVCLPWIWVILLLFMWLIEQLNSVTKQLQSLKTENIKLKAEIGRLKSRKYVDGFLDSDANVNFFTGLKSKQVFEKLHSLISPLVVRRWLGVHTSKYVRKFNREPRKFGPVRKITSKAEFLLTLMRLRLGLMGQDLAKRFNISEGLCSKIFLAWLCASAEVFRTMIVMPDEETLIATKPMKFRHIPELHSIIDCTEIFIETPKDLQLQSATWSDYKHHNTMKVLVACLPNSSINYVSPAYTGRISDKALTLDCGYLDQLPPYCVVMADKGFNISNECAVRNLTLYVPPGRRGSSQMSQACVKKTRNIANNRILIEQVIRRLKTFKIIQNELPISLVPHIDDVLQVCGGICNL